MEAWVVRGVETNEQRLKAAVTLKKLGGVRNVNFLLLDVLVDILDGGNVSR